jgi:serine/threonine-protein kinase
VSLPPGARIGVYDVTASIGAGGMGEVYRARDSKLNRDVAIKVLPEFATGDADRVARFAREAQLLAALNHPNIAQIYGFEPTPGGHALVMELIDGQPLSELVGSLSVADSLAIARQIADALEAAHEKTIIHRDMKPGNVMVTRDGQVKVLDFGLGKTLEADAPGSVSNSPTMTVRATQAGMILGTAGYMSPEQAKGRTADKRSDVWAFGCILYEMLAGRRAFEGDDVSDTIASVLRGEPDWSALPAATPPTVRLLIERCLVKERARRISDISTAKFLLNEPAMASVASGVPAARAAEGPRSIRLTVAAAAVLAAIAITALVVTSLQSPAASLPAATVRRLSVTLPPGQLLDEVDLAPLAISPDGLHVVYTAMAHGKVLLYQRALDDTEAKSLPGTEGAQSPFFSFDGKWIGFFAGGQLKKVTLDGGALEVLCPASYGRGGTWGDDGQVYFAPTNRSGIWRVSEKGGTPTEFTRLDLANGEVSHRWPQILAANQGLLFTVWTGPGPDEKSVVLRTAAGAQHVIVRGGDRGRYVPPGYLVYGRGDGLMARRFDPSQAATSTDVPTRLPGYLTGSTQESPGFEVSPSGVLATVPAGPNRLARRLVWVDDTGRAEPLPVPAQTYEHVRISPDGRHAVVQILEGVVSLWLYDFERKSLTPFVKAANSTQAPIWTHDGQRVIYRATRQGSRNLYWRAADGSSAEERLTTKAGVNQTPQSVSADGKWVIFAEVGGDSGSDVFRVSLDGARTVEPLLAGPVNDGSGVVSPAPGHWMAVTADDSGRPEVYVRPYPGPGPRIPISRDGGLDPSWSRDGRRLFFVSGDAFMAADVTLSPTFSTGVPRELYRGPYTSSPNSATPYSQAKDGRFLRVQPVEPDPPPARIDIVTNWLEELRRLVK